MDQALRDYLEEMTAPAPTEPVSSDSENVEQVLTTDKFTIIDLSHYLYDMFISVPYPLGSKCTKAQWKLWCELRYLPSPVTRLEWPHTEIVWPEELIGCDRPTTLPIEIFTRFPDLPKELRLQIWTYLLPPPRLVHLVKRYSVHQHCKVPTLQYPRCEGAAYEWYTPLSEVCRESFELLSSNYYTLSIETSANTDRTSKGVNHLHQVSIVRGIPRNPRFRSWEPPAFFNCSRDTLVVSASDIDEFEEDEIAINLSPVRSLALGTGDLWYDGYPLWDMARLICPTLKNLTVLLGPLPSTESPCRSGIERLMKIDNECYMVDFREAGGNFILEFIEDAEEIRKDFRQAVRKDKSWLPVAFSIALIAFEKEQSLWYHEVIPLPTVQLHFVEKPFTSFIDRPLEILSGSMLLMFMADLNADAYPDLVIPCHKGGMAISLYDGLTELFQQKGSERKIVEERTKRYNQKRDKFEVVLKERGAQRHSLVMPTAPCHEADDCPQVEQEWESLGIEWSDNSGVNSADW